MKRWHRAWAVCLGCTIMLLICSGLGVNAFSVSQPYILAQNGFTNTQTSMIITVRSVLHMLSMLILPLYYKKLGYRLGMTLAVLLSAGSFALFAVAKPLWSYYLAGAFAGLALGLGCSVPATILMVRWFASHRAMAIGLCAAGTGLATVVFSPILTALTVRFGLRTCFFFETGICLVSALAVFLLISPSPKSSGCAPYGTAKVESAQEKALHDIHPSRVRWACLYVSMAFLGAVASVGFSHMMILYTTAGIPGTKVTTAVSIFGFMLMAGKFAYGVVCDRLGTPRTNRIFAAMLLSGLALCCLADLKSLPLMYLGALLYGGGVPLNTVGLSIWATDFSPTELVSHRLQRFQLCYALGSLVFSFMPGVFADLTGSYAPSYLIFIAFSAFAVLTVQSTYRLGSRNGAGV